MATKSNKQVLYEVKFDAGQAKRRVEELSKGLIDQKWALKEAKAAGDEQKLAVLQQEKALYQAKEEVKKFNLAMKQQKAAVKEVAEETKGMVTTTSFWTSAMKNMSSIINPATIGIGLLAGGIYKLKGMISSLTKAGKDWEGTVGDLGPQTQKLADSVGNLIGQKDLSRLVEYQKQLKLSEKETHSITQAAIHYGRVAKKDFGVALKEVTDAVVNGKSAALRKLGIDMADVSGSKSEKMNAMLKILTASFGNVSTSASNAAEQHDAYKNKLADTEGQIGSMITKSEWYKTLIDKIAKAKVWLVEVIGDAVDGYKIIGKSIERFWIYLEDTHAKILDFIFKTNRAATLLLERENEAGRKQLENYSKFLSDFQTNQKVMDAKFALDMAALDEADVEKKNKRQTKSAKSSIKIKKDEYNSHINLFHEYESKMRVKEAEKEKRERDQRSKDVERNALQQYRTEVRFANLRSALAKKQEKERKEAFDSWKAKNAEMIESTLQLVSTEAVAADSFGQFAAKMSAHGIKALSDIAMKKAAMHAAEAIGSLAIWDFRGAALHTAAAGLFAALGIGSAMGASAISGAGSSSGSGLSSAPTPYSSSGSNSFSDRSSGGSGNSGSENNRPIVNVHMKSHRVIGATKRDIRNEMKRVMAGV